MPETFINNVHIFQLGSRDPQETINVSMLSNELGEGYHEQVLFGSNCGTRTFALNFPALNMNTASCELDGVVLKPAEYLFELFMRQKTQGLYFAIQSHRNGQYYLCKFIDHNLTMQGIYTRLFSGSAMFTQVRQSGTTVFDSTQLNLWGLFYADNFDTVGKIWTDTSGNSNDLFRPSGGTDYVKTTSVINGQTTLKFNSAAGSSFLTAPAAVTFKELFAVLKINEATFSGDLGIISGGSSDSNGILIGANTTTRFYDLNYDAAQTYFYSKDGTSYAESDQQAPMNAFAIVYVRASTGIALTDLQIGKDRNTANYGKCEIAELALTVTQLPTSQRNELLEHLVVKYAL